MIRDPRLRFPLFFLAWLVALTALSNTELVLEYLRNPLCLGLAHTTSWLLALIGVENTLRGATIFGTGGAVRIVPDCDGVVLLCYFLAAVLAFPKRRPLALLPSIGLGLALIFGVNVFRVAALTLTEFWYHEFFEFTHFYVLQGAMILITTLVWLAWANHAIALGSAGEPAGTRSG